MGPYTWGLGCGSPSIGLTYEAHAFCFRYKIPYTTYISKKVGYIILKITLFSIFPFCRPSAYTYHNPPFLPEPLLMTVVPPMPSVSVDFTKYAETRRSGAEGSINYLPLS